MKTNKMETIITNIQFTDFGNICRFCLKNEFCLIPIFKENQQHGDNDIYLCENIVDIIAICTSLEVKRDDKLPMFICNDCFSQLMTCVNFRNQCLNSTEKLEKIKNEYENTRIEKIENDSSDGMDNDASLEMEPKIELDENCVSPVFRNNGIEQVKIEKTKPERKPPKEPKKLKKKPKVKVTERKEKPIKEKKRAEPLICQICGASVLNLNNHVLSMHTEKIYNIECDICHKKFYNYGRMKEHIIMVHIDERKYKCTMCPNAFNAKYILTKHLRTHTGEKNYRCDLCDRSFGANSTLKKHRLSHTQERKFACEHCDKRFARRDGLRNHVVIHTGDRPYKCGLCPLTFKFSSTASQHRRAHVNREPYTCTTCQMGFKSIMLYRTHMKIHKWDSNVMCIEGFQ